MSNLDVILLLVVVFLAHICIILSLVALSLGAFLVFSAKKVHKEISVWSCKFVGYVVMILSIIMLLLSGYNVVRIAIKAENLRHDKNVRNVTEMQKIEEFMKKHGMKLPEKTD